jgi:hypothetical protein
VEKSRLKAVLICCRVRRLLFSDDEKDKGDNDKTIAIINDAF